MQAASSSCSSTSAMTKTSSAKRDGKTATTTCCGVRMELFSEAKALWAGQHNQVSCQHDKDTVVLFRACCQHLGPHATTKGSFRGSPCYEKDRTRMMWFDTSFLVSMRKSCWGTKSGREVVLAIWVKRSFLEQCLSKAVCSNIFGPPAPPTSAAAAAARGGGRPKPARSLRTRVGSGILASFGSEVSGSPAAQRRSKQPGFVSSGSVNSLAAAEDVSALGRTAMTTRSSATDSATTTKRASTNSADYSAAAAAAASAAEGAGRKEGDDDDEDSDSVGERQHRAFTSSYAMAGGIDDDGDMVMGSPPGENGWTGEGIVGSSIDVSSSDVSGGGGSSGGLRPRSHSLSPTTIVKKGGNMIGISGGGRRMTDSVRLHWEPERLPSGEKHRTRRVPQIGLKGKWLEALGSGDVVVKIRRLDELLAEQRAVLESSKPQLLKVPVARPLDCSNLTDSQLEALHLVSERACPKLRILCLHGYLQNAQIFSQRTRQLCKKLRPMAELVYVDAPHLLSTDELPPPRVPSLASPRVKAAEAAAKAATAAAAKVVITGEGGAPGVKDKGISDEDHDCDDSSISATSAGPDGSDGIEGDDPSEPSSPKLPRPPAITTATDLGAAASPSLGTAAAVAAGGGVVSVNDREGARTWWRCDAEERRIAKAVKGMSGRCEWKGLEESLACLRQVWDERGPFDGILGFSQGAAMASIFNHCMFGAGAGLEGLSGSDSGGGGTTALLRRKRPPLSPPPSFAMFVSGCYQPHPTQIPSYPVPQEAEQVELPSLHVWAVEDPFVPAAQSQRLAGMYLRSSILMHRGSHCVPQNKDTVQHFMRFLEEFRYYLPAQREREEELRWTSQNRSHNLLDEMVDFRFL